MERRKITQHNGIVSNSVLEMWKISYLETMPENFLLKKYL